MPQKNKTIDHNLLVDFNSSLSTILEDAEHQQHKHQEKGADIEKFKYTGDNSYVTSILTKAHTQFPDEPDLAAIIALMGKEEQEDEIRNAKTAQWIHQTQQKIDQQQQSLGQHSADLQDKEARFRAQDQRFQDFNAQVAAMNLNPVQQAQAAQEFQKNPEQDPEQVLSKYKAPEQKVQKPAASSAQPAAPLAVNTTNTNTDTTNTNTDTTKGKINFRQLIDPGAQAADINKKLDYLPTSTHHRRVKVDPTDTKTLQRTQDVLSQIGLGANDAEYEAPKATGTHSKLKEEGVATVSARVGAQVFGELISAYRNLRSGITLQFGQNSSILSRADIENILLRYGQLDHAGKEKFINTVLIDKQRLDGFIELTKHLPKPRINTKRVPSSNVAQPVKTVKTTPADSKQLDLPLPPPQPEQGVLFETKNTIEDDLLLEYLVSLNTLLDNASK